MDWKTEIKWNATPPSLVVLWIEMHRETRINPKKVTPSAASDCEVGLTENEKWMGRWLQWMGRNSIRERVEWLSISHWLTPGLWKQSPAIDGLNSFHYMHNQSSIYRSIEFLSLSSSFCKPPCQSFLLCVQQLLVDHLYFKPIDGQHSAKKCY